MVVVVLQKSNTCCTCFVASSDRQSNFGRNGISISSGGAESGVEQLWSDDRNMGKCYKKNLLFRKLYKRRLVYTFTCEVWLKLKKRLVEKMIEWVPSWEDLKF